MKIVIALVGLLGIGAAQIAHAMDPVAAQPATAPAD